MAAVAGVGASCQMLLYHEAHPLACLARCRACFDPLAARATDAFRQRTGAGRVGVAALPVLVTLALSAPSGGMRWQWHDMRAGCFPPDWGGYLLLCGSRAGLAPGWLIVLLSMPSDVLCVGVCYGLLAARARLLPVCGAGK